VPADGRLDLIELVVVRANGHPALAAYLPDAETDECRGYGIMVLTVDGAEVATITGFPGPTLYPAFALPGTVARDRREGRRVQAR
jgi:RNA polymerase sigma-70 factor (ECF subfamily)